MNKLLLTSLLALVLVIGLGLTNVAAKGGPDSRPFTPIMAALDPDGNDIIDAAELANASQALLTLDQDGDGALSCDEIRPDRRGRRGSDDDVEGDDARRRGNGRKNGKGSGNRGSGQGLDADGTKGMGRRGMDDQPHSPLLHALDANGDLAIDSDEVANAATALTALDADQSGTLTMEEVRPEPRGRRGNGPKGNGQGRRNVEPEDSAK